MNEFSMHDATREGDLCRVRQLIEAGMSVDGLDEVGDTPLHSAALYGRYEVAALLIDSKCNINLKDRYGRTPVLSAASCGRKDIVDLLLHRGAQVNCVDDSGRNLLYWASQTGWTDILRLILDNGEADLNAVGHQYGSSPPLLPTSMSMSMSYFNFILLGFEKKSYTSNVRKRTVLHWAAQGGHTRVIQILLEKEGLDLNPQDVNGDTPLHLACQIHWREAIKQLLDAGADVNIRNTQGFTALSEGIGANEALTIEEIRWFVQKGAFLEHCNGLISPNGFLPKNILNDVEICTQSVINKFNHQSLPALNSITYFARRLPNVDNFKLGARHIDEVENLVKCEIERNTFCDVVKVHPIALSALCVLSLITCQSGKKRAASPDFGHSPFKKIHN